MSGNPFSYGTAPYNTGPYGGVSVPLAPADVDELKEIIYHMLENNNTDSDGVALATTMFTRQQMIDALNESQNQFLDESSLVMTRTHIETRVNVQLYNLPADTITARRVSITSINQPFGYGDTDYGVGPYGGVGSVSSAGAGGQTRTLTQIDPWEADYGLPSWQQSPGTPVGWIVQGNIPNLTFQVVPAPNDVGQLYLLYVALGTALTGAGIALTVPYDWSPYVKWRAMAILLASDGESYDPDRAEYCNRRYEEGVEMARLVLGGAIEGIA